MVGLVEADIAKRLELLVAGDQRREQVPLNRRENSEEAAPQSADRDQPLLAVESLNPHRTRSRVQCRRTRRSNPHARGGGFAIPAEVEIGWQLRSLRARMSIRAAGIGSAASTGNNHISAGSDGAFGNMHRCGIVSPNSAPKFQQSQRKRVFRYVTKRTAKRRMREVSLSQHSCRN